MLGSRRKAKKPLSDDEYLAQAIADAEAELDLKERKRRRRYHRLLPAWLDRRLLWVVAAILCVLLADGVRRENQEFTARLTTLEGQVGIMTGVGGGRVAGVAGQLLEDGSVVTTGPSSWAAIEFPDGSAVTLDYNTVFVVRLLEYSRGGRWRSRSFFLTAGRMWARVGENFGAKSEQRVHTPTAVAAVRGTQYAVIYDTRQRQTRIQCNDGYVTAEGFTGKGSWVGQGGETTVTYGRPPSTARWMKVGDKATFAQGILNRPIPPELWLKTAELTITQTLDAPLSILGIGKASWARGAADIARRTATMEQLRRIQQLLEGSETYPMIVNPATLEELRMISPAEAQRLLKAFDGNALVRYEALQGGRNYRITVRARDKKRTVYELTQAGVASVSVATPSR